MKTAISVPDDTFERASQRAAELGMSRSEFFSRAANRYLTSLDSEATTRRIDAALDSIDEPEDSTGDAVARGRSLLDAADDEW